MRSLNFNIQKSLIPIFVIVFVIGILGGTFGSYVFINGKYQRNQGQVTLSVNEDSAIINSVKQTEPAVVSITGTKLTTDFFGKDRTLETAGTGIIVEKSGLILTNKHVVDDGSEYNIFTNNGKKYKAKVKSLDANHDLALLKVEAENLPTAIFGDSDRLELGQNVIAIGNALGQYDNTVTTGIISGLGRTIQAGDSETNETLENVIQTDAVINQGNSGGPLINLNGQVVGINTATDAQGEAIGFAIPINVAKDFINIKSIFSF